MPLITGIKLLVYDLMFFTKGFKLFIARLFLLKLSCHWKRLKDERESFFLNLMPTSTRNEDCSSFHRPRRLARPVLPYLTKMCARRKWVPQRQILTHWKQVQLIAVIGDVSCGYETSAEAVTLETLQPNHADCNAELIIKREEIAWPSGQRVGLTIWRSRVRILLWSRAGF